MCQVDLPAPAPLSPLLVCPILARSPVLCPYLSRVSRFSVCLCGGRWLPVVVVVVCGRPVLVCSLTSTRRQRNRKHVLELTSQTNVSRGQRDFLEILDVQFYIRPRFQGRFWTLPGQIDKNMKTRQDQFHNHQESVLRCAACTVPCRNVTSRPPSPSLGPLLDLDGLVHGGLWLPGGLWCLCWSATFTHKKTEK